MTITWRIAVALAVVTLVTAIQPACVFACSCRPPGSPAAALADATAVFAGRVTAISTPANSGGPDPTEVTFTVARSWKGADRSTMVLRTPASSASCGVDFVQGQEYLVYARDSEGRLETNLCSRTTQLGMAGEDLAVLGAGSAPAPSTGGAETPSTLPATGALTEPSRRHAAAAGAALLLILLGAGVTRQRSAG